MTIGVIMAFVTILTSLLGGMELVDRQYMSAKQVIPVEQIAQMRKDLTFLEKEWAAVKGNITEPSLKQSLGYQVMLFSARLDNQLTIMETGMSVNLDTWRTLEKRLNEIIKVARAI